MAAHYSCYNQNSDKKTNIHINPNFNKSDNNAAFLSSNMYLNPNFSHATSKFCYHNKQDFVHQASKTRIHVNPDFIKNANVCSSIVANRPNKPLGLPSSSSNNLIAINELKQESKQLSQVPSIHVTKSRYCIVNQKENVTKTSITRPVTTTTVKVNKYKSVSLSAVKKNLTTVKSTNSLTNVSFSQNEKYKTSSKLKVAPMNTRFKFVKHNIAGVLNQPQIKQAAVRRYSLLNKSIQKTASRKINNKLVIKKNNVPCPLFKKYGKCLRKIRSNCEYLHDKKHVSICRKFLIGICHDENCLLSHDLTDKKMPTCYFYLQGACTRECCPYLHVKLNEKIEICKDFLTGYCEKGDQCLFRHINVCRNLATKRAHSKKVGNSSVLNINYAVKIKNRKSWLAGQGPKNVTKTVEEQRYFKESVKSNFDDNMIKPSRIKLGTLPSFIQL